MVGIATLKCCVSSFICYVLFLPNKCEGIQLLLGHTKLESTVHYLGIEVEDALALSEETEV